MILIDWLAESESQFLGHIIVIIWHINSMYTIMTLLPLVNCYKINRASWPMKWKIPMNRKASNQSKSIIGLRPEPLTPRTKQLGHSSYSIQTGDVLTGSLLHAKLHWVHFSQPHVFERDLPILYCMQRVAWDGLSVYFSYRETFPGNTKSMYFYQECAVQFNYDLHSSMDKSSHKIYNYE